jgi:hypothetical protein
MTTARSPLSQLRAQANNIASLLKKAERGEKIDERFAEKIARARGRDSFKAGIVMDDKTIVLELPWTTIRETTEAGLAEFILGQMREARDALDG